MANDKILSLGEAVHMVADEGCRLAFGGVTLYRRPMAFPLTLLARHSQESTPRDLILLCFTAGLESDILVRAGMVSKVRTCYFGLDGFGLAPHFTTAVGEGAIEIIEETVIGTTEKIVPRLSKADIFGLVVDAVVETPGGAWPTSCHPLYSLDGLATLEYTETAGSDSFPTLLATWCSRHGVDYPS